MLCLPVFSKGHETTLSNKSVQAWEKIKCKFPQGRQKQRGFYFYRCFSTTPAIQMKVCGEFGCIKLIVHVMVLNWSL